MPEHIKSHYENILAAEYVARESFRVNSYDFGRQGVCRTGQHAADDVYTVAFCFRSDSIECTTTQGEHHEDHL